MVALAPEVLVVEDDPDMNQMLGAYVTLAGYGYLPALDGQSALATLRSHRPAMVLLDLMLPDLDGLELCKLLRADFSRRDTPVVILTARDEPEARRRAAALSVQEYLTKPFDPDVLLSVLRRTVSDAVRG